MQQPFRHNGFACVQAAPSLTAAQHPDSNPGEPEAATAGYTSPPASGFIVPVNLETARSTLNAAAHELFCQLRDQAADSCSDIDRTRAQQLAENRSSREPIAAGAVATYRHASSSRCVCLFRPRLVHKHSSFHCTSHIQIAVFRADDRVAKRVSTVALQSS